MKERCSASDHNQKLKYHIQAFGLSLHAQEIQFNDIRTKLKVLFDTFNSLHTNAYDEAITTPTPATLNRGDSLHRPGLPNHDWNFSYALCRRLSGLAITCPTSSASTSCLIAQMCSATILLKILQ